MYPSNSDLLLETRKVSITLSKLGAELKERCQDYVARRLSNATIKSVK